MAALKPRPIFRFSLVSTIGELRGCRADWHFIADFRPPTMYYTTIPLVSERPHIRRWDASKLRELRKRLDTATITVEEIDNVAADFLDGEIVDLASDWLGNTVGYCRHLPSCALI